MADPTVLEVYRREVTPELYREIRELYKTHSIAEDARDLEGLISTLTPDCVYELVQTGHRWEGHDGARRFYTELLTAFPDIQFNLTDIVIGPQGVCEEANVSATQQAPWLGVPPVEGRLEWKVLIWFPWDPEQRLFRGEKVYTFGIELPQRLLGHDELLARDDRRRRRDGSAAGSPRRPAAGRPTYVRWATDQSVSPGPYDVGPLRPGAVRAARRKPDGERQSTNENEELPEHLFA